MALTVQQLNADTSFLLVFKPAFAPGDCQQKFPGSFSILIDPWLDGPSSIYHPKFVTTRHTVPPAIRTLKGLKEDVDLIVISQDKPDHCHRETLCSLPRDSKTRILATPRAANKIREWRHFKDPSIISEIPPYNPSKRKDTILRFRIPPYSSASAQGEVTIANISTKADLTRLHNAIGITYCPPGTIFTTADGISVKLTDLPSAARPGSAQPPQMLRQRPSISTMNGVVKAVSDARPRAPSSPTSADSVMSGSEGRSRPSTSGSKRPAVSTVLSRQDNYEDVVSVVYTPHGIEPSVLQPYVDFELALLPHAMPITALFHALNVEKNPKLLGGVVSDGAPGGIRIIEEADVKYWIAAHDETKDTSGWATKFINTRIYEMEEVIKMLRGIGGISGMRGKRTVVEQLGAGGIRTFRGG